MQHELDLNPKKQLFLGISLADYQRKIKTTQEKQKYLKTKSLYLKVNTKNYEDILDTHKVTRFISVYCFQYFSMNIGLRAFLAYYEVRLKNYTGSICK